ncbi:unnamed protein product [Phytophthora fragariaefolia]|uniref:Unnamed protein product n=1 Tax=Phytophthora fragariaefolia TaxID=1490495 RepID=A0A9W6XYZ5_9STRA|nr:unnamed protein product [Phytophthora fragariaefolia]
MARTFGLSESEMPTLRQVQWFVSSYTKKSPLHRYDDYDDILDQIDQLANGHANIIRIPHGWYVQVEPIGYPVIVCGTSDRGRSFHFVTMFITSRQRECLYMNALMALRKMFSDATKSQLRLKYAMTDAEAKQLNAVNQVFGVDYDVTSLMCFSCDGQGS